VFANICQAFATFRDYRAGPVKHPLFGLLMILLLSRIAGCRGWDATADWAAAHYGLSVTRVPKVPIWKVFNFNRLHSRFRVSR
jgi:hypothetical protein